MDLVKQTKTNHSFYHAAPLPEKLKAIWYQQAVHRNQSFKIVTAKKSMHIDYACNFVFVFAPNSDNH